MGLRTRKYWIALAALAALTLGGCPKKESPEDVESAAQEAKKAAQERKKKVDVFDEFYVDDAKKASDSAKGKGKVGAPTAEPKALAAASGTQKFSGNGRYVIQVNSTASESGAAKMVAKMKNLGYPAYVVAVQNPAPGLVGTYFRVRLGGFDSYPDAKAFAESTLEPAGYDYWIDRKTNDNVGVPGSGFGSPGGQPQYPAAPPQQGYQPAPQPAQGYRPAPAPQQGYQPAPQPAPQPAQGYRPAPAPQQGYQPAPQPAPQPAQGYRPAPAPQQGYQPAPQPAQQAAPPQPRPAQPTAQTQQQPPATQPAARPQQPPPAPAVQPVAKPQQSAPTAPAAKPQQPADSWGTGNDWGSDDW